MKRNGFILMLLLFTGSFSTKLVAQQNLDALIKKCEAMSSIDISYSRTRNAKTKELEREIINYTIRDNPALINEFLTVFKKEEANAIQSSENKQGGRTKSLFYRFENATYSFSYTEEEKEAKIIVTRGTTNASITFLNNTIRNRTVRFYGTDTVNLPVQIRLK